MWKYLWKWFTVQIWAVSVRGLVAIRLLLCSVEGHNAVRGRVFMVVWLPTLNEIQQLRTLYLEAFGYNIICLLAMIIFQSKITNLFICSTYYFFLKCYKICIFRLYLQSFETLIKFVSKLNIEFWHFPAVDCLWHLLCRSLIFDMSSKAKF